MAAFVFVYWLIVSSGIRVCKFLIISNTSLQYKSRHFSHRKKYIYLQTMNKRAT